MGDRYLDWLRSELPAMEQALERWVGISSHSDDAAGVTAMGEAVAQVLAPLSERVERVPGKRYGDAWVFHVAGKPSLPPVALIGHLDTVFPKGSFEGYRVDGHRRCGPGTLDMKGGIVVMAWALKALAMHGRLGDVPPLRLVFVSDEEVGSPEGIPVITRAAKGCAAALVFESGRENDAIVTERKGVGFFTFSATGRAAHAGNNHADGVNALWVVAKFVDAVQGLTDYARGVTVNVGKVSGGQGPNTVPDAASADLEIRFCTRDDAERATQALAASAQAAAQAVPGASGALTGGILRYPMEKTPASAALCARYGAAARLAGLGATEASRVGGGSDACTTAGLGIPSIDGLGPRGKGFHTRDEYIEVETLVSRAAALAYFLLAEGGATP